MNGDPRFRIVTARLADLHDRKQADYGRPGDPFANIRASSDFGIAPWVGAMVRANDKMRRLQSAAQGSTMQNESVLDSLLDIAVYAINAAILLSEDDRAVYVELFDQYGDANQAVEYVNDYDVDDSCDDWCYHHNPDPELVDDVAAEDDDPWGPQLREWLEADPSRAELVRELRTSGSTWRGVAGECSAEWNLRYGSNQIWGQDLCSTAADVLGHDVGFDACTSTSPLEPDDYQPTCRKCVAEQALQAMTDQAEELGWYDIPAVGSKWQDARSGRTATVHNVYHNGVHGQEEDGTWWWCSLPTLHRWYTPVPDPPPATEYVHTERPEWNSRLDVPAPTSPRSIP